MYELREYQKRAVDAGIGIIKSGKNGLLVLPTASGKSLVIAEIVRKSAKRTVILQPTKEILEQNLEKIKAFGLDNIGVFSASMNEKTIGNVTVATIGSIVKYKEKFLKYGVELIIADEADLVNSKGGQYEEFISHLGVPVIGLTATPYRMKYYLKDGDRRNPVVESRFLTRTRPRIFNTIAHITQIPEMFERGYLCPLDYTLDTGYDSRKIRSNSTGQGYDEKSLLAYNNSQNITDKVVTSISQSECKYKLIFSHFREESSEIIKKLSRLGIACKEISGDMPKKDRESVLAEFRCGGISIVNVGVLVAGYDFPELDMIVLARPTKSLRLYTQMVGRGLRIAEGKKACKVVDLCDNVKRFGEINTFVIEDISGGNELWRLKSNVGYLTGVNINNGDDLEAKQMVSHAEKKAASTGDLEITFGKHRGTKIGELDMGYMQWCIDNFDPKNKWRKIFKGEIERRIGD
jgi:DNA repair protein RadD